MTVFGRTLARLKPSVSFKVFFMYQQSLGIVWFSIFYPGHCQILVLFACNRIILSIKSKSIFLLISFGILFPPPAISCFHLGTFTSPPESFFSTLCILAGSMLLACIVARRIHFCCVLHNHGFFLFYIQDGTTNSNLSSWGASLIFFWVSHSETSCFLV